jgi:hypothetical protein
VFPLAAIDVFLKPFLRAANIRLIHDVVAIKTLRVR